MSIVEITNNIYNIDCPELDIGQRRGWTSYIDFIDTTEFPESFRKGTDIYGRNFVVFRANIYYANGQHKETFTTLFQRYADRNHLWMTAGKTQETRILFDTTGGANIEQLKLTYELLKNGQVELTDDMILTCKIEPYFHVVYSYDNPTDKPEWKPTRIELV